MASNIEIEIQVQVEKIRPLINFLAKEARFLGEKRQIDEYFTPKHRNFISERPVAEWLRLRNAGNKYSINYKNWHFDKKGKSHFCDEFESQIKDIKSVKKIFSILNFKLLVKVDKIRRIYQFQNYEIAIDQVKKLGNFVEMEYKGRNRRKLRPAQITQEMIEFLKKIGVGEIKRNYVGYPFLMLFPKEVKYEKF